MARPWRYYLTFFLGYFEMMFFGGIIFGWASLVYVLKSEGYFNHLCVNNETISSYENITESSVCDGRDANLNLVFTIAVFSYQGCMFFLGFIFDTFGTRYTRLFLHFLLISGFLMIILSSPSSPDLLFPAMMCIATGGIQFMPTNLQIGNLFDNRRSTVMTALTGAFDASSFVMLLIKMTYKRGVSLDVSFSIMIGASLLFFINTFGLLPIDRIPWPLPLNYGKGLENEGFEMEDTKEDPSKPTKPTLQDIKEDPSTKPTREEILDTASEKVARRIAENYRNKDYPDLKSCIFSPAFWLLAFWLSALQLKAIYYVGTFNPYLVQITDGDEEQISFFTEVFSFCQFGGVLAAPLGGFILDRNKGLPNRRPYDDLQDNVLGFIVTSSLFILFSICNIIPVIEVQYITFVLQVVTRSLLFGILLASMASTFPSQYYGSLIGVISGISAVTIVLQYPLFIITQEVFNNDSLIVNAFLLIICCTTLVVPAYFYFLAKRKNTEVEQLRQSSQNEKEAKKSAVFAISGL